MPEPLSLKIPQGNIDENFRETIEVTFLNDRLVKRDPPIVNVSFQVDKLVEVNDSVRIEVINAPKQVWPFVERKKLPCRIAIPQAMLNFYHPDSIRAVVDLGNFTTGEKKVLPSLRGLPPFTRILALDSVFIKL